MNIQPFAEHWSSRLISELGLRRGRRTEARVADTLAILAVAGTVQRSDAGWFAPRRVD